MRIKLKNVRIAYPELFNAKLNGTFPDQPAKYNCRVLLDKSDPQVGIVKSGISNVATDAFKDKATLILKSLSAQDRLPIHDGDLKPDLDGHEGNYYLNLSSKSKPTVLNKNKTPATESASPFYSGCRADVILEITAYLNRQKQHCVSVELAGVMFVGDDEPLATGSVKVAKADEFDDYEIDQDNVLEF